MMRTPRVVCSRTLDFRADVVWTLLADLSQHSDLIPFTTMQAPARITEPGDTIVARSAVVLVDRMTTLRVDAQGDDADDPEWVRAAVLRKDGPLLFGLAGIAVRSEGADRATVLWAEDVNIPALGAVGRFVEPVLDVALRLMGKFALLRLENELRKRAVR